MPVSLAEQLRAAVRRPRSAAGATAAGSQPSGCRWNARRTSPPACRLSWPSRSYCGRPMIAGSPLDKVEVAASFSRAAAAYDSVAALQRDVGLIAAGALPGAVDGERAGAGPRQRHGLFLPGPVPTVPRRDLPVGLDIAQGMVEHARTVSGSSCQWLVGDAGADSACQCIGGLCLQLSGAAVVLIALHLLLAELARVLQPGGRCLFTSLGPGTLRELRQAWAAVDQHQHVNTFLEAGQLLAAAGV